MTEPTTRETSTAEFHLNGALRPLPTGGTVLALLQELQLDPRYLAVERNREVVPRARHGETHLQPGDAVEIVTLVGGG